jgi:hypothetical protein
MDLAMDVDDIDVKEEIETEESSPLLETTPTVNLEPGIDVPAFLSRDHANIDPLSFTEEFRIIQIDSLISSLQNAICTEEDEDVVPIAIPFIVSLKCQNKLHHTKYLQDVYVFTTDNSKNKVICLLYIYDASFYNCYTQALKHY